MSNYANNKPATAVEKKEKVAEEEPKQVEKKDAPAQVDMDRIIARMDQLILKKRLAFRAMSAKKTEPIATTCVATVEAPSLPPTHLRKPRQPLCRSDLAALCYKEGREAYLCEFLVDEYFFTRTFGNRKFSALLATNLNRTKLEDIAKDAVRFLDQDVAFVLLPVELNDHWIVLIIGKNKLSVYNPLHPQVPTAVDDFRNELAKAMPSFVATPRAYRTLPVQKDSVSCGPMICMFVEQLVTGNLLKWNQKKADEDLLTWRESYLQELQGYTEWWNTNDTPISKPLTDEAAEEKEMMDRVWKYILMKSDNFPHLSFWEACHRDLQLKEPIDVVRKLFADTFYEQLNSQNVPVEKLIELCHVYRMEEEKQIVQNLIGRQHVTHRRRRVDKVIQPTKELVKEDAVESIGGKPEDCLGEPQPKKQRLELQVVLLKLRSGRRDDYKWIQKACETLGLNGFKDLLNSPTAESNDCFRNAPGYIASFDVSAPSTIEKLTEHMKTVHMQNAHSDVFILPYLSPDHYIIWIFICFVAHELGPNRDINVYNEGLWGGVEQATGWMVSVVKLVQEKNQDNALKNAFKKIDRTRQGRLLEMCVKEDIATSTWQ